MIFEQIIPIFFAMFILIDPLGVSMVFLSLTTAHGMDSKRMKKTALRASIIAIVVLTLFIFLGQEIIEALGILPGSLYVAGGILLFFVSMDLLFGKPKRTKTDKKNSQDQLADESDEQDIAIFPLALPLLAGPGAITALLLYGSELPGSFESKLILTAIVFVVLLIAFITMFASNFVLKVLGKTGVNVIERIMGILLAGMSVQFVYNGLVRLQIISIQASELTH